jgi:hypothetical protein
MRLSSQAGELKPDDLYYLHQTACGARGCRCNEPSTIVLFVFPAYGRKSKPPAMRVVVDYNGVRVVVPMEAESLNDKGVGLSTAMFSAIFR